jgi:hypothetical protein
VMILVRSVSGTTYNAWISRFLCKKVKRYKIM